MTLHRIYPNRFSEFEVQAELYGRLRMEGFHVRGEVKAKHPDTGRGARFDLVVFSSCRRDVICVIEVKRSGRNTYRGGKLSKEAFYRETASASVLVCRGMDGINPTVDQVRLLSAMHLGRTSHHPAYA